MPSMVTVLIPAHNEEKYIFETIRAVSRIPNVQEILVVDDASEDATAAKASMAGARVLTLPVNQGKGGALNEGLNHISGDFIAVVDGDLGDSAGELSKLIFPVINDVADMTIARFPEAQSKGGFGLVRGLARRGIKNFAGIEVKSPLSGQRVLKRAVIDTLGGFETGFGVEVAMTIDAVRKGFRILEVDVNMTHAESGRNISGFLHRGKQFIDVAKALARRAGSR